MLINLHVKNLALIDDIEVDFGNGLNIFTGETGAGKSMLIGSVLLALGKKADKNMIRNGKEYCLAELIFKPDNETQKEKLKEMGFFTEEDGTIAVSRKITASRTTARVGGESVNMSELQEITGLLMDVYGQNEHQSLTKASVQLDVLDEYAKNETGRVLDDLKKNYSEYKACLKEYEDNCLDETELAKKKDYLEYEIAQIENANLKPGEDEDLETLYQKLSHGEKLMQSCGDARENISERRDNALDLVGSACRELSQVSQYDDRVVSIVDQLSQVEDLLSVVSHDMRDYIDSLDYSEETLVQTESRLNQINDLKSRYGNTIETILNVLDEKKAELEKYNDYEIYIGKLKSRVDMCKKMLDESCRVLSEIRFRRGKEFSAKMVEALEQLNFNDVRFNVSVVSDKDSITSKGWDKVTYEVSTNPGEPVKSLSLVASGGELSRMMLALKTLMAETGSIDTLVFDEIDTGISGKTAALVASKLKALSKTHQVLCITHLPQIAAACDHHFLIEKKVSDGVTNTSINLLDEDESINELARMLGAVHITEEARQNAIALKRQI